MDMYEAMFEDKDECLKNINNAAKKVLGDEVSVTLLSDDDSERYFSAFTYLLCADQLSYEMSAPVFMMYSIEIFDSMVISLVNNNELLKLKALGI